MDSAQNSDSRKAAIYVRVSTTKQEAENQLRDLRAYCQKTSYEVYQEYVDVISGKENSRTAFDCLFQDAHKRLFDVVVFWDLSRFSRSGALYTLQKLQELQTAGTEWESYQEPIFRSAGPFREAIISILATLAKIEREKISERTKSGLARVKAQGGRLGRPPISDYQRKRILDLYGEGLSINQVSKRVNTSYATAHGVIRKSHPSSSV